MPRVISWLTAGMRHKSQMPLSLLDIDVVAVTPALVTLSTKNRFCTVLFFFVASLQWVFISDGWNQDMNFYSTGMVLG